MKTLYIIALSLIMSGCANAQPSTAFSKFDAAGESMPAIRHMVDMKVSGDTLLFVYESENGYGQRLLRRAVIDRNNNALVVSPDMGKRENGYFASYMPYPFIAVDSTIRVVSQDDCEIYTIENDTAFIRSKQYLMTGNSTVPFPISQYVQDVFMTAPDNYVFIGREPKGGRQYAMKADLTAAKIDAIRQINISSELQSWMPNTGEMVYSGKHNRLAFAYKLLPFIEIFDTDGKIINFERIGDDTFNPKTLDEADFDELNSLHTVDVTYTPNYIYALYWGFRYAEASSAKPIVYKISWDGKIIKHYKLSTTLYRIAAIDDSSLIGWSGKDFYLIQL